ncbi:aromatic ring-hydroxylating oxygenase subunit alpha [Nocardioides daejeonensis]|uniref:aromatic ring-hydroxylating dioxygenase subunit alpha n=1 Tax=Nocardioides daejeonensis TaxID=1046556 RepID=UPI000D74B9A4|nr:aromatic ring-hydroxylating dioxygenase subunit alpha [Nocardioides daejeonensis]
MVAEATLELSKFWHPIARSEDVTDKPERFGLLNDFVVAFRHEGELAVFKDMCVHRGAALSQGWVKEGKLVCPYHGWQYNTEGTCVRIPSRPESQPIPELAHAIAYTVQERYGLVWVVLGEPAQELPSFPDDCIEDPAWKSFISYKEVWKTSAARTIENFMDFSHFPYVHPGLLGTEEHTEIEPYKVIKTPEGLRYIFEQVEPSDLYGKGGTAVVEYEYIIEMPFFIHLKKRVKATDETTIITLVSTPLTEHTSELYVWIVRNHAHDAPDSQFGDFTNTIMEQDRPVVESQRPEGIPDSLKEELHLMPADNAALVYRQKLLKMAKVEPLGPYGA